MQRSRHPVPPNKGLSGQLGLRKDASTLVQHSPHPLPARVLPMCTAWPSGRGGQFLGDIHVTRSHHMSSSPRSWIMRQLPTYHFYSPQPCLVPCPTSQPPFSEHSGHLGPLQTKGAGQRQRADYRSEGNSHFLGTPWLFRTSAGGHLHLQGS